MDDQMKEQPKKEEEGNQEQPTQVPATQQQPQHDSFIEERLKNWSGTSFPEQQLNPFHVRPAKSKLLAGLLAFFFPGIGHFYLGLMQRGLFMMLLFILDIFAIVFFSPVGPQGPWGFNIPLITLFALFIPVIYFYNIFDALQSTETVNYRQASLTATMKDGRIEDAMNKVKKGNGLGWLFIAAGAFFFFMSSKPDWLGSLLELTGSYIGAIVLIAAGVFLFHKESKEKRGKP